jgi:hypothetical protein
MGEHTFFSSYKILQMADLKDEQSKNSEQKLKERETLPNFL